MKKLFLSLVLSCFLLLPVSAQAATVTSDEFAISDDFIAPVYEKDGEYYVKPNVYGEDCPGNVFTSTGAQSTNLLECNVEFKITDPNFFKYYNQEISTGNQVVAKAHVIEVQEVIEDITYYGVDDTPYTVANKDTTLVLYTFSSVPASETPSNDKLTNVNNMVYLQAYNPNDLESSFILPLANSTATFNDLDNSIVMNFPLDSANNRYLFEYTFNLEQINSQLTIETTIINANFWDLLVTYWWMPAIFIGSIVALWLISKYSKPIQK